MIQWHESLGGMTPGDVLEMDGGILDPPNGGVKWGEPLD